MIIIDFSGIAIGGIASQRTLDEDLIRHSILNTIRMYRVKFTREYGELVIACDGANNWRRKVFPQYKANRKTNREKDTFDWSTAFNIMEKIRSEIEDNFPYKVVKVDGCEADDIIGTLVEETQEFGKYEPVMIVSADGDFKQLQRFNNVKQYSPLLKKFVVEEHPRLGLVEKIVKGDKGDGVPNILSNDDCFIEGLRQTPISKKRLSEVIQYLDNPDSIQPSWFRNYQRNKTLIDLTNTPKELKETILNQYSESDPWSNKGKVFPYLVEKNCKLLIECVEEFIQ